jgi:hypothetical protein
MSEFDISRASAIADIRPEGVNNPQSVFVRVPRTKPVDSFGPDAWTWAWVPARAVPNSRKLVKAFLSNQTPVQPGRRHHHTGPKRHREIRFKDPAKFCSAVATFGELQFSPAPPAVPRTPKVAAIRRALVSAGEIQWEVAREGCDELEVLSHREMSELDLMMLLDFATDQLDDPPPIAADA